MDFKRRTNRPQDNLENSNKSQRKIKWEKELQIMRYGNVKDFRVQKEIWKQLPEQKKRNCKCLPTQKKTKVKSVDMRKRQLRIKKPTFLLFIFHVLRTKLLF